MTQTLLIGIDQGSSSTKGVLYDPRKNKILAGARARVATNRSSLKKNLDIVEHSPEDIVSSVRQVLKKLLKKAPAVKECRVGLAAQRSSFLLLDAATRKPMTPVISWQDTRGAAIAEELKSKYNRLVYKKTGLQITPYYPLTKLLWLFNKNPGWKKKARMGDILFAPLATYLALNLTQEKTFTVDPTHAQRSLLMNLKTCAWDKDLLQRFDIPQAMLPAIKDTVDDYGTLARSSLHSLSGHLSLSAVIGDQQAAAFAVLKNRNGCGAGGALINLGTGGFLIVPTGIKLRRAAGLLSGILFKTRGQTQYFLEGTVSSIGGVLKWLKTVGLLKNQDAFGLPQKNQWLKIPVVTGCFGGLASPFWRSDIRLSIHNLERTASRENILTGLILGLAHLFWEILDKVKGTLFYPQKLIVSGGLSKSNGLKKVLSDYLEIPLQTTTNADLTALGACLAAQGLKGNIDLELERTVYPAKQNAPPLRAHQQKVRRVLKVILKGTHAW